jgi:hypothetical protein
MAGAIDAWGAGGQLTVGAGSAVVAYDGTGEKLFTACGSSACCHQEHRRSGLGSSNRVPPVPDLALVLKKARREEILPSAALRDTNPASSP